MRHVPTLLILTTFLTACASWPADPSICPAFPAMPETVTALIQEHHTAVQDGQRGWLPGHEAMGQWLADLGQLRTRLEACR